MTTTVFQMLNRVRVAIVFKPTDTQTFVLLITVRLDTQQQLVSRPYIIA